jgi:two-component system, chemotaxis family, CheB/CheR fusion protein
MTARKKAAPRKSTAAKAAAAGAASVPAAPDDAAFPIVGIGASAGGLAAFEAFFSAMPASSGMAFVIVQHLAPDHKSILTDLIGRYTKMQVVEAEDGLVVRPDCTYIIPPNRDIAILNGTLKLLEFVAPRGQRLPVDFFFRSLAQDQHARAIGIVLSGTGSDGTQGVRSIKGEGGMVMAQDFDSTQYDGMPRSAVATGMVDYVLPPAEMPAQLISYAGHAFGKHKADSPAGARNDDALKKIIVVLRAQAGHDFSQYKQSTVYRRVERRMAVHQIEEVGDYVRYLQKNASEVDALFRDLLIGVTSFFRDPEAFQALQDEAIVRLLSGKPAGAAVRVWVPGCSTGEEAYSIAILLQERMDALKSHFKLTVFATDIDDLAIERARAGVYPTSIAADVSPERLKRYFSEEPGEGLLRVNKLIRDMLVFSVQNVIKDPPFSKLDLISCRNLLIYMGPELHNKLVPLFHYALNPGGYLLLGTSESIGEHWDLFATLNRTAKLYQRKEAAVAHRLPLGQLPPLPASTGGKVIPQTARKPAGDAGAQLRELTERTLLRQFAPAGALVNERGDILYLHGRTGEYLEPAAGEAGLNIVKMAREGLRPGLTVALRKAGTGNDPVLLYGLRVKTNGAYTSVNLRVEPLAADADQPPLFLVTLEPSAEAPAKPGRRAAAAPAGKRAKGKADGLVAQTASLQRELREKEEYLQTVVEELETTNEELKSSNEEMQSINEEMQSTNEELETSREELQSVNEELATVNAELQGKVHDLSQANNDMNNLLAGTGVGTIFVDHQQCITRFTPSITQVISLIATDVGRPVGQIVSNLTGYDRLVEDVQHVLDTLVPEEIEVRSRQGTWYVMRIRPYRTLENVIEGAVITFFDITEMKQAREALRDARSLRQLAAVMTDSRDAIVVQDLQGGILSWNPAATRLYGWSEAEALAMNISQLTAPAGQGEALSVIQKLGRAETLQPYRMERLAKDGKIVRVVLTATALIDDAGEMYAVSTTERADA